MLVLRRQTGESIVVPEVELVFTVLSIQGNQVCIGVSAPPDVLVHREEVWERIQAFAQSKVVECQSSLSVSQAAPAR